MAEPAIKSSYVKLMEAFMQANSIPEIKYLGTHVTSYKAYRVNRLNI